MNRAIDHQREKKGDRRIDDREAAADAFRQSDRPPGSAQCPNDKDWRHDRRA
jgi:hypothetical protein